MNFKGSREVGHYQSSSRWLRARPRLHVAPLSSKPSVEKVGNKARRIIELAVTPPVRLRVNGPTIRVESSEGYGFRQDASWIEKVPRGAALRFAATPRINFVAQSLPAAQPRCEGGDQTDFPRMVHLPTWCNHPHGHTVGQRLGWTRRLYCSSL